MNIKPWLDAARLRTLPLSVSGIILGSGLADFENNILVFVLCILTTISFQTLSNFANDYGDGIKGTDANKKGEKRMVASGRISPKAMKTAIAWNTIIAFCLACFTLYVAFGFQYLAYFSIFMVLGVASIFAAITYTVGKNAYGYSGFGDIFVFLFFGWLSTMGSYFLFTKTLNCAVFLPASSIGLLSVAVLNLNNMRDQIEDKLNHKNTLVVKLGPQKAKVYHYGLIGVAFMSALIFMVINHHSTLQYISLLAFLPLVIHIKTVANNTKFEKLDVELKKVALSTFLFAVLFAILY